MCIEVEYYAAPNHLITVIGPFFEAFFTHRDYKKNTPIKWQSFTEQFIKQKANGERQKSWRSGDKFRLSFLIAHAEVIYM